jgi:uncharacterized repeat protein (TIGR03837 family)
MHWAIFCKVIDNLGDAGVCWRLARGLASAGETVCLWIDAPEVLAWLAPQGHPGVAVRPWHDGAPAAAAACPVPNVLVEAFGCNPAPESVARFAEAARQGGRDGHVWINLEYLSAEPGVERLHGLPSPVFSGPGAGLTKYFFYPGFVPATGGLLREPDLGPQQQRFDRTAWLASQGIRWQGERLVSLFCYEPPALGGFVDAIERGPVATRLLVTHGRSSRALPPGEIQRGALRLDWLPRLPQTDFDRLLWSCDLNFVRGEDSLVRALWAGAPFVWQIYPQDDDAHHTKLEAFLDWLEAPLSLRLFHRVWNGTSQAPLPAIDDAALAQWRATVGSARDRLWRQDGLVTQLRRFAAQKS